MFQAQWICYFVLKGKSVPLRSTQKQFQRFVQDNLPSEILGSCFNLRVEHNRLKREMAPFEIHSSTWQLEVSIAGAGLAISGQFINRADNWENRASGAQHSWAGGASPIGCSPAHCYVSVTALLGSSTDQCKSVLAPSPFLKQQSLLVNSWLNGHYCPHFVKRKIPMRFHSVLLSNIT